MRLLTRIAPPSDTCARSPDPPKSKLRFQHRRITVKHRATFGSCILLLVAAVLFPTSAAAQRSCESLTSLSLPNATITSAMSVAAGTFKPPAGPGQAAPTQDLPA